MTASSSAAAPKVAFKTKDGREVSFTRTGTRKTKKPALKQRLHAQQKANDLLLSSKEKWNKKQVVELVKVLPSMDMDLQKAVEHVRSLKPVARAKKVKPVVESTVVESSTVEKA
jgi:hypothetical protein